LNLQTLRRVRAPVDCERREIVSTDQMSCQESRSILANSLSYAMESKVCRKCFLDEDHGNRTLFKCAKCSKYKTPDPAFYCSRECQKDDWENGHKDRCKKVPPEVVAARARSPDGHDWCQDWRKCVDTSLHFGDLELITWDGLDEDGETERGWGGCYMHQADTLKRKFEVEMGGDKLKLLFDRGAGNAFRWTCCGMSAWGGK
jgi:hypothetical protein